MKTDTMVSEKRKYNKGGNISRFEPSNMKEFNVSPFIKISFEDVGCLGFCERFQELGCYAELTSLFATNLKRKNTTIVGMGFLVSTEAIGKIFRVLRSFVA